MRTQAAMRGPARERHRAHDLFQEFRRLAFDMRFNCSQITLSIFTLILYVIVRCPAIYNLTKETKER